MMHDFSVFVKAVGFLVYLYHGDTNSLRVTVILTKLLFPLVDCGLQGLDKSGSG